METETATIVARPFSLPSPAPLLRTLLLRTPVLFASGCASLFPVEAEDDLAHFATRAPSVGEATRELQHAVSTGSPCNCRTCSTVKMSEPIPDRRPVSRMRLTATPVSLHRLFSDVARSDGTVDPPGWAASLT